jgi:LytS/YehU family sensor histidine kinase
MGSPILVENALKTLFLFAILPSAISFYLYYLYLFPRYLQQKRFLLSIPVALVISLLAATIGFLLLRNAIESGELVDMDKKGTSTPTSVILVMSVITTISGIIALVIKGFISWVDEIKLKEELKSKNHQIEMALVKAQLDPHFLFNTLNNIDVLIIKNPEEASNYLNKLSDILRFMLYETKTDTISLSKEIDYIEKYIELQKIRTSNAHFVNFSVTGMVGRKTIAPMIFIPFIENAFKHTGNKKLENAINIYLNIENGKLEFVCENRFEPKQNTLNQNNGLGNELIQKRLDLIYPKQHDLKILQDKDLYRIHLTIYNE